MFQVMLCLGMMTPAADPAPCPDCPPKMVCVKECTVKKITTPVYHVKCTEYCVPHRSLIKTLLCMGDDALCCSQPRVKHQLVKRIHTEEKCVKQCTLKPCDGGIPVAPAK
jgi:hypothetical protein